MRPSPCPDAVAQYEALRAYALGTTLPGAVLPLGLARFRREGMVAWLVAAAAPLPCLERASAPQAEAAPAASDLVRLLAGLVLPLGRRTRG